MGKKTSSKSKEVCPTCKKSFVDLSKHKCKSLSVDDDKPVEPLKDNDLSLMFNKAINDASKINNAVNYNGLNIDINKDDKQNVVSINPVLINNYLKNISSSFVKPSKSSIEGVGFCMQETKEDFISNLLKPNEQLLLPPHIASASNSTAPSKANTNDLAVLLQAFYDKIGDNSVLNILEDGLKNGIPVNTSEFIIQNPDDLNEAPYKIDLNDLGISFSSALKIACDYISVPNALVDNNGVFKARNEESEVLLNSVIRYAFNYIKKGNGLNGFTFTKPGTALEVLLSNLQDENIARNLIETIITQLTQKESGGLDVEWGYVALSDKNEKVSINTQELGINYKNVLTQLGEYAGLKNIYSVNSNGKLRLNNGVDVNSVKDIFLKAYNHVKSSPDKLQSFSYKSNDASYPVSNPIPKPEKKSRDWFKVFDNIKKFSEVNREYESLDLNLKKLQVKMNNTAIERKIQVSEVQRDGLELWLDRKYNDLTGNIDDMIKLMSDESNRYGDRFAKIEESYNNLVDEFNIYLTALKQAVEAGLITIIT